MLVLAQDRAPLSLGGRAPLCPQLRAIMAFQQPSTILLEPSDLLWEECSLVYLEKGSFQIPNHPNNLYAGSHLLSQKLLQGIFPINMLHSH